MVAGEIAPKKVFAMSGKKTLLTEEGRGNQAVKGHTFGGLYTLSVARCPPEGSFVL